MSRQSDSPGRSVGNHAEEPAGTADTSIRPVALVTGGTKRVGLAIGVALVRAGCDVVFTYRSSRAEAEGAAAQLWAAAGVADSGGSPRAANVSYEHLDLADLEAIERFGTLLMERTDRLDIVVHNASVYGATPLGELRAEDALTHYRVNALGPLMLSKVVAPMLARSERAGGGSMVAMLDIHAMGAPRARYSAYSMSKAALHEMVRSLARELAPRVRVNGVAPGVVAWPESGEDSDAAMQAAYVSRVPMGRAGTPAEAAEAVRWLAMDAHYTTGHVIRVDGGRWMGS